jgi:hypothetical protein
MSPFASLFRAASESQGQVQPPQSATVHGEQPHEFDDTSPWDDTAWGFYDSSTALRQGLDVTEHVVPVALLGLLQDISRSGTVMA